MSLVVSMSGVTYAAGGVDAIKSALDANSVGSKEIKNGQVKHADLGKNAVHGDNVCADCLGGREVKESLLGKVPAAAIADHASVADRAGNADTADRAADAGHATSADSATSAGQVAGLSAPKLVKVAAAPGPGTTVTLFEDAALRFTGTCVDNGGGNFTASASVEMKQDHSVLLPVGGNSAFTDIGPSDGPQEITYYEASGTGPDFEAWSYYNEFNAGAPDGTAIQGFAGPGVHVLGADCIFQHYEIGQ